MGNSIGYVSSYTKNSDGTYTGVHPTIATPSQSSSQTSYNYIGILNSNNIISPQDPSQFIVMSNDNKYIFIPNDESTSSKIINYYLNVYTIKTYNTNIPLFNLLFELYAYVNTKDFTLSDSTYNSISSTPVNGVNLKVIYGVYLVGLNPPDKLLSLNPNKSQWKDCAYYVYTYYNFIVATRKINPKYDGESFPIPSGNGIIPDNFCIATDSPSVISSISTIDCRNVPSGSPIIYGNVIDNYTTIFKSNIGAIVGIISCCCCCMIFCIILFFYMTRKSPESQHFKHGGFSSSDFTMSDLTSS